MASLRVVYLGSVDGDVFDEIIDESILPPFVFFSGCGDEKCIPIFCDVRHVLRKLCVRLIIASKHQIRSLRKFLPSARPNTTGSSRTAHSASAASASTRLLPREVTFHTGLDPDRGPLPNPHFLAKKDLVDARRSVSCTAGCAKSAAHSSAQASKTTPCTSR